MARIAKRGTTTLSRLDSQTIAVQVVRFAHRLQGDIAPTIRAGTASSSAIPSPDGLAELSTILGGNVVSLVEFAKRGWDGGHEGGKGLGKAGKILTEAVPENFWTPLREMISWPTWNTLQATAPDRLGTILSMVLIAARARLKLHDSQPISAAELAILGERSAITVRAQMRYNAVPLVRKSDTEPYMIPAKEAINWLINRRGPGRPKGSRNSNKEGEIKTGSNGVAA